MCHLKDTGSDGMNIYAASISIDVCVALQLTWLHTLLFLNHIILDCNVYNLNKLYKLQKESAEVTIATKCWSELY